MNIQRSRPHKRGNRYSSLSEESPKVPSRKGQRSCNEKMKRTCPGQCLSSVSIHYRGIVRVIDLCPVLINGVDEGSKGLTDT